MRDDEADEYTSTVSAEEAETSYDGVAAAARMLEDIWASEVISHRVSRRLWDRVRRPLANYPSEAPWLRSWYRDSVLAGCRRLLDRHPECQSLVRALEILRDNAYEVTLESLVPIWADHLHPDVAMALETQATEALERVGVSTDGLLHLDPDIVQADLDLLAELGKDIRRVATRLVAHRDPRNTPIVMEDQVDALLQRAAAIHARWYLLLLGAQPDQEIDHIAAARHLVRALELYDSREYFDALQQAEAELRPAAHPDEYAALRRQVRVTYHFGDSA